MTRTAGSMRNLPTPSNTAPLLRGRCFSPKPDRWPVLLQARRSPSPTVLSSRSFAHVRQDPPRADLTWFTPSRPALTPADSLLNKLGGPGSQRDHRPPDERTLGLGKTLRTLSPLLPNLFTHPLPPSILSPDISLHLFPSTHPHLPAVKGKVAYRAALWTAPVAWGSVPLVGNVQLEILSEKIVRTGHVPQPQFHDDDDPSHLNLGAEKLVVRWKTKRKPDNSNTSSSPPRTSPLSNQPNNFTPNTTPSITTTRTLLQHLGSDQPLFRLPSSSSSSNTTTTPPKPATKDQHFTGLFIFTFDRHGRVATHTIEHADESRNSDQQRQTSRVITLTDWLLGRARWRRDDEGGADVVPGLAMTMTTDADVDVRRVGTRGR